MKTNKLQQLREEYNYKCAVILSELIAIHPELRIEQILQLLDDQEDRFYEEPNRTYERWVNSDLYKQSLNV